MINPLLDVLRSTAYHNLGIVPITDTSSDVNQVLAQLPPEEARKMRRKFRKLWRAAVKSSRGKYRTSMEKHTGFGATIPNKTHRRCRKAEVRRRVQQAAGDLFRDLTSTHENSENSGV